jgi:hypothetical protein
MKTYSNMNWRKGLWVAAIGVFVCGLVVTPWALAGDRGAKSDKPVVTKSETGSSTYKTTVHRDTAGELSTEDFRQVSTLASQVLTHVGVASEHLVDDNEKEARTELQNAETLVKVIRDLLPTTTVTTVVTDAGGKEVYRYEEKIQEDKIPLYDNMVAVDVLQAMVDKKKEEAALQGLRLADAQLIHTSALLDLSYVERKVDRALELMKKKPEEALAQLLFANSRGVRLVVNREDDPLVKAQAAIRIAERMTREGKHEAADENLTLARLHLATYRAAVGTENHPRIKKLQDEIQAMAGRTGEPGATDEIRGFWDRVTSWFKEEAGQIHVTADGTPDERVASGEASSGEGG